LLRNDAQTFEMFLNNYALLNGIFFKHDDRLKNNTEITQQIISNFDFVVTSLSIKLVWK